VTKLKSCTIRLDGENQRRFDDYRKQTGATLSRIVNIALKRFFESLDATQSKPA
jgi:antitoxin component of RelBE/YafQ-DinJ toxin-antitoxin module